MSFLNPEYFWLFLFLLAGLIKKDFRGLTLVAVGYILTFVFIIIALARPIIEQEPIKTQQVLSDVVIAVDLSYSMQGTDLTPTRLAKAKEYLTFLVKQDKKTRFGVLGFTTNAIILSPLTQDSELLLHLFSALDDKLIITKGSNVMPALILARKLSKSKTLSVVLLSDGADEVNYSDEAYYAKKNNLIVNIMMLATPAGSTLRLSNGNLLENELGDIVVSRANENIKTISNATGGVYSSDFRDIVSAIHSQEQNNFKTQTTIVKNLELFYYFVALAILFFLLTTTTLKRYIAMFLLIFGINLNASNYLKMQNANAIYNSGEYEKALASYSLIKSNKKEVKSVVYYNMGNAYVRLKEFKKAKDMYLKSLTLEYSPEADENLQYIKEVKEQKTMQTGQQKTKNRSSMAKKRDSTSKKKEGGGSNMKVSANSSSGAEDGGKKTKSESRIDMSGGKAKLSSKQYELINKRQINEKQPW